MRKMAWLVCVLAIVVVTGCGGGGSGSSVSSTRSGNTVTLSDNKVSIITPGGSYANSLSVTSELPTDFSPPLAPAQGQGAFLTAANLTGTHQRSPV